MNVYGQKIIFAFQNRFSIKKLLCFCHISFNFFFKAFESYIFPEKTKKLTGEVKRTYLQMLHKTELRFNEQVAVNAK